MKTSNALTDLQALQLHRSRAQRESLFLQEAAAVEIQDRLSMVNRSFTAPVIVTPFSDIWQRMLPGALVIKDDETLDLKPGSHDLVVHSLSLHWANDPIGQLIQCRRALRPDGMMIGVSLGGQTLQELRACLGQAEVEITGGLSPRIAPMGEIRDLGGLLQRAGLALPVADSLKLQVEYRDCLHLMQDLRRMGETNALVQRHRTFAPRDLFALTSTLYDQHYKKPSGRIGATFEMVFLTGWAPDESQPKPLKPGSAKQRLADALAVPETPLRD